MVEKQSLTRTQEEEIGGPKFIINKDFLFAMRANRFSNATIITHTNTNIIKKLIRTKPTPQETRNLDDHSQA